MSQDTFKLNQHFCQIKESATLAINIEAKAMRVQGKQVGCLGFGESPFPIPTALKEALKNHADKKSYLPTQGLLSLREKIAKYYKEKFQQDLHSDQIFIGPGSKELLYQVMGIVEGSLIVPAPSWVSYVPQAQLLGKEVEYIQTARENSYKLTPLELEQVLQKRPNDQKILILNNPNNPTGAVYSTEEIKALARVCEKYPIIVFSDEIYAEVQFESNDYASIARFIPQQTIVFSGISKAQSAGGYRLGYCLLPAAQKKLADALKSFISETFSAVSAPIQYAAQSLYEFRDDVQLHINHSTKIHEMAGTYLAQEFQKLGLNCPDPKGAFYLFPDFENFKTKLANRGIKTSEQLSQVLLHEFQVATLAGSHFYRPAEELGLRIASVDYDGERALSDIDLLSQDLEKFRSQHFTNLTFSIGQVRKLLNSLA